MNVLLVGPYIGSFEEEIINFRPYARWLYDIFDFDVIYINTHSNRKFLYNFLPVDYVISTFEYLSRDEISQNGYTHDSINSKDYNLIIKGLKERVSQIEDCNKKDLIVKNLGYTKSTTPMSYHSKKFERIDTDIEIKEEHKKKIVFIPSKNIPRKQLREIKIFLDDREDYLVVGDLKTRYQQNNPVIKMIDYFENGYKYIVQCITEAKAVICPMSHWTIISNLQGVPVFSWGENVGQFKEGGIYHFGNKGCYAIPVSQDTNTKILVDMVDFFVREINNEI